jgi:predicted nucleic acid-binding protein
MRDLFPGFYDPTEQEITKIWQDGIFVFDANILLNIYRYSHDTRERFFETLSQLKERIWIPYQAAYEYQYSRTTVISEQVKAYDVVAKLLDAVLQSLRNGLEPFKTMP